MSPTATSLADGTALCVGGFTGSGVGTGSAETFDSTTNSWSTVATLSNPRGGHTATLLNDGTVIVTGGQHNGEYLSSAEIFET